VVFIGNISGESVNLNVEFGTLAGEYSDWFSKDKVHFESNNHFWLDAWQYTIFIQK
jgi:hypothetical protein